MCTLTYIPISPSSFVWTQNRDESPNRQANGLINNTKECYPLDPKGGGTWICMSSKNKVVSLLNGAFKQKKYVPSTGKSRGLVVLEYFKYNSTNNFFESYSFEDVEPFTMIIYEDKKLWEFRWDKIKKHIRELDCNKAYIWSSVTLYDKNISLLREQNFKLFIDKHSSISPDSIMSFHRYGGDKFNNSNLVIDRGIVKTVSITQIIKDGLEYKLNYHNLETEKIAEGFIYSKQ